MAWAGEDDYSARSSFSSRTAVMGRYARKLERLCCAIGTYLPLVFVYGLTSWAVWVDVHIGATGVESIWIGELRSPWPWTSQANSHRHWLLDRLRRTIYPSQLELHHRRHYGPWIHDQRQRLRPSTHTQRAARDVFHRQE